MLMKPQLLNAFRIGDNNDILKPILLFLPILQLNNNIPKLIEYLF